MQKREEEQIKRDKLKKEKCCQDSHYKLKNKVEPDNNSFFEQRSNPLSSKGN